MLVMTRMSISESRFSLTDSELQTKNADEHRLTLVAISTQRML